jgi:DNA primase
VSNALKQEIFIKEISTKFELSEQSLFNELGVQKQIVQQHKPSERKETNVVKLEKVQEILENINPLLVLEEKLVELMLKYGDYVLDRKLRKRSLSDYGN